MAAAEATKKAIDGAALVRRIRLGSGLVLAFFVTTHFLNHALGLISLEAMEQGRLYFMAFWRAKTAMYVLYGALLTHLALGLWSLYRRRPILRVPPWELAQMALGLAIPPILVGHVFDTHFGFTLAGVDDTYAYVLLLLWVERPHGAVLQIALLLTAWLHACIGLHYWLRIRPWYPKAVPALYTVALLLPVLALLGFVQGGVQVIALAETPMWLESYKQAIDYPDAAGWARIRNAAETGQQLFLGGIALALIGRGARRLAGLRRKGASVRYPDGGVCHIAPGTTILEASRIAGRPHASVCGGRGRCSTCRDKLLRQQGLDRVGDGAAVRLHRGGPGGGDAAIGGQQIFVEVPARRLRLAQRLGDPAVERVGFRPGHRVFRGHREVDPEIHLAELPDLLGAARLLPAEIVRRHAQHDEAAVAVLVPQRLQPLILRRETAARGGVHHQHRTAAILVERQRPALDGLEAEIEAISGRGLGRCRLRHDRADGSGHQHAGEACEAFLSHNVPPSKDRHCCDSRALPRTRARHGPRSGCRAAISRSSRDRASAG